MRGAQSELLSVTGIRFVLKVRMKGAMGTTTTTVRVTMNSIEQQFTAGNELKLKKTD